MVRAGNSSDDVVRLSTHDWLGVIAFLGAQLVLALGFFWSVYAEIDRRLATVEANQRNLIRVVDKIEDKQ